MFMTYAAFTSSLNFMSENAPRLLIGGVGVTCVGIAGVCYGRMLASLMFPLGHLGNDAACT